ncbi:MAG: selenide, water dikinase SelD [Myxococcales bacterium FL481]|nr:MAG: selenide, water dikinase SelD [Myxococcales bacterium FL481]
MAPQDPQTGVLVGSEFSDDAAIVRMPGVEDRNLVLTADVIAPLVDDPRGFGALAACNALSDVYAMGGTPLYALNLVFFPDDKLPLEVLREIMAGAAEVCAQAKVPIVGGHTVRDPEIKFGLSVTGEVDSRRVWSNRNAQPGQHLVLTKALGTGVVGTAIKQGVATASESEAMVATCCRLNRDARDIGVSFGATACTDVTGFGLLGHLRNILRGSDLAATLRVANVPWLPGAVDHARHQRVPGGSRANLQFVEPSLRRVGPADPVRTILLADAQTSGGLLLCVDPSQSEAMVDRLAATGHDAAMIGELTPTQPDTPTGTITLDFRPDRE